MAKAVRVAIRRSLDILATGNGSSNSHSSGRSPGTSQQDLITLTMARLNNSGMVEPSAAALMGEPVGSAKLSGRRRRTASLGPQAQEQLMHEAGQLGCTLAALVGHKGIKLGSKRLDGSGRRGASAAQRQIQSDRAEVADKACGSLDADGDSRRVSREESRKSGGRLSSREEGGQASRESSSSSSALAASSNGGGTPTRQLSIGSPSPTPRTSRTRMSSLLMLQVRLWVVYLYHYVG